MNGPGDRPTKSAKTAEHLVGRRKKYWLSKNHKTKKCENHGTLEQTTREAANSIGPST